MKVIILSISILASGFFGVSSLLGSDTPSVTKNNAIQYFETQTNERGIVKKISVYTSPKGYKGFRVTLKKSENILNMGYDDTWIITSGAPDDPVRISPTE